MRKQIGTPVDMVLVQQTCGEQAVSNERTPIVLAQPDEVVSEVLEAGAQAGDR
jgi:hypothetical protein